MAKKHRATEVRLFGGVRRDRRALMMTTALQATALLVLSVPGYAQPAPNARPMGGQVVVGQASIANTANNTAITQGSQRAAINWTSFDIGRQQSVTFAQPSSSAIALNRVIGPDPSQIAGKITANGQVALVNQSGVVFYKGSQVNVSTLIVSAAGITDKNFAAGRMIFDQPARPNARIENHGEITVKETGLAALVAPQVVNSGTITAKLGHVVLAGATTHTVDLYGDGLLSIDVTGQVKQVPVGADGKKATALVTNTGVIAADGGTITLTAQAADGIVQTLVSAGGKLRANSVGDRTGTIRVTGIGGSVTIEGAVAAEGVAAGTRGGQIELAASNAVRVASGATVSASGHAGGGTVAVGTTLARARGGAAVKGARTAKSTVVESGATIRADATAQGDGGRVVLLSTERTDHAGAITARGGAQGGNGGFAEVSGDQGFALAGTVDLGAPSGHVGTLLIDPADLKVIHGTVSETINEITDGAVNNLGKNADVVLQATNSLTVNGTAAATGAAVVSLSNHALTLQSTGTLALQSGSDITATTITLDGGPGLTSLGGMLHGTTSIALNTTGDMTQPTGSMTTPLLTGTVGGELQLTRPANQIDALGNLTVAGGDFNLVDSVPLVVSGPVSATKIGASIGITDDGALTVSGGVTAGNVGLSAGSIAIPGSVSGTTRVSLVATSGAIDETGSLTAGTLTGGSTLATSLTGTTPTTNQVETLGNFTAGTGFTLRDGISLDVTGTVNGNPTASITDIGTLTVSGGVSAVAVDLNAENIGIPGSVAGGSVNLVATNGTIGETGSLAAGMLTGSSTLSTSLIGKTPATNQVDFLDNFTVGTGFALVDGVPLTVRGVVSATQSKATISITDSFAPPAPSITAISITNGKLLAGAPSKTLPALDGTVNLTTPQPGADVREPRGTINAEFLTGSVGGALHLADPSNIIDQLGNLTILGGNFTLADSVPLTISGTVAATQFSAYVGITDLALPPPASSGTTGISITGSLTAGTTPPADAHKNQPSPSGTLELVTQTGMDVTEPSTGVIKTGWLGGTIGGALSLNGTKNEIAAIGAPFGLTVNGGNLTLVDSVPLVVNRNVEAKQSGAIIDITDTFDPMGPPKAAITIRNGQLLAGAPSSPPLALDGSVNLTTTHIGAYIEEPRGTINAHELGGSAGGSLHLADPSNIIDTLGKLTINGNFTLVDSVPLTVSGPVHATPFGAHVGITDLAPGFLGMPSITFDGSLIAGIVQPSDAKPGQPIPSGILELFTPFGTDVAETPNGSITTGWLGGGIGGGLFLNSGGNRIAAIGAPFGLRVHGGDIILTDSVPLAVNGPVVADTFGATISLTDTFVPTAPSTSFTAISINTRGSLSAGHILPPLPGADGTVILTTTQAGADVLEPDGFIAAHVLEGNIGGSLHLGNPRNRVDRIGSVLGLVAAHDLTFRDYLPTDYLPLIVDGLVKAGDGHLLQIMAPALTMEATGLLTVDARFGQNPLAVTPGRIVLQADAMSLALGTINAPDGMVAIAPRTAGTTLSLDPVTITAPGRLSLTQADLNSIHTLGITTGPLGTQTLVLGSLNGLPGPGLTAGQLQINTNLYDFTNISRTLALLSAGDITETATATPGGVKVTALTGAAPNGNIDLSGPNQIAQTGNLVTVGNYTANGPYPVSNLTAADSLLLVDGQSLNVLTSVSGGPNAVSGGVSQNAEIDVLGGSLTVAGLDPFNPGAGSVTAGNVFLRAGDGFVSGNVTVNGVVTATGTNGEADLVAGMSYTPGTFHPTPWFVPGAAPPGSAGAITINGSVGGPTVGLYSANDTTESGIITAGLLKGQAGVAPNSLGFPETLGNVVLTGATTTTNQIATLGSYLATGGFLLNDGKPLTVVGAVNSGTASTVTPGIQPQLYGATINVPGNALTITGSVTAGAPFAGTPTLPGGDVALNAGSITLVGAAGAPRTSGAVIAVPGVYGGGTVSTAAESTIVEDVLAYIQAFVFTGSSGNAAGTGAGSAVLTGGAAGSPNANTIQLLGPFTTNVNPTRSGDFFLQDRRSLTVNGAVTANNGNATIIAHGDLVTNAPVRASASANLLADGSITNNGGVGAGGNSNLTAGGSILNNAPVTSGLASTLLAQGGSITDQGGVNAGTTANLTANGSITQNAGTITAAGTDDAVTLLAMTGAIQQLAGAAISASNPAGSVRLTAATSIADAGIITAGAGALLTAQTSGITVSGGGVHASGGNATLLARTSILDTGGVTAGQAAALTATTASITENAGVTAGTIATLIAGSTILTNGAITAGTDASLTAATEITDNGGVTATAGNAGLTAGGSIFNNALVTSGLASALVAGGNITDQGGVAAGTIATLTAGGTIATNRPIIAGTNANLTAGTDITENGGIAAAAGNAGLTAGGNIFNNALMTSGLAATLVAIGGNVTDQGGVAAGTTASLTAGAGITQNAATITAAGAGVTLTSQGGGITQAAGATISATNPTGTVALNAAQGIAIGGTLVATGGGAGVTLAARNGDITETNAGARTGIVDATFLTGSAGGNVTLDDQGNQIGTVGAFAARGGAFTLADGRALTINGPVSAATNATITDPATVTIAPGGSVTAPIVNFTAADIGIQGSVAGASTVSLVASNGGITEPGTLTAGTLTVNAPGAVALPGATPLTNRVAILGNLTAGSFTLVDGQDLTIAGMLNSPNIHVDDNGFALGMANGTVLNTGGVARPLGKLAFNSLPTYAQGVPGAYLRAGSLQQVGNATIASVNGGPTTFRIDITSATGNVAFGPAGGLTGNTTDLVIDLTGGTLTGQIFVKTLDLRYVPGAGNANLAGTVNGLGGPPAAGVSYITPLPNPRYQINGCPITAVNCILLSVAAVPVINPLQDIYLGVLGNPQDDDDLLLPDVSERDY